MTIKLFKLADVFPKCFKMLDADGTGIHKTVPTNITELTSPSKTRYGIFVKSKRWLNEEMFAELFAIAQGLPGPASTQLTFAIAMIHDGIIPGIWSFFVWRYA